MVCYRIIAAPYVRNIFAHGYTLDDDLECPIDNELYLLPKIVFYATKYFDKTFISISRTWWASKVIMTLQWVATTASSEYSQSDIINKSVKVLTKPTLLTHEAAITQ